LSTEGSVAKMCTRHRKLMLFTGHPDSVFTDMYTHTSTHTHMYMYAYKYRCVNACTHMLLLLLFNCTYNSFKIIILLIMNFHWYTTHNKQKVQTEKIKFSSHLFFNSLTETRIIKINYKNMTTIS